MIKNGVTFNLNFWIIISLTVLNLIWLGFFISKSDGLTHIYFLDVGQGDSILITMPNQKTILIDGGPSPSVVANIDAVLPFWKRNIDLMILTHPHADHAAGLIEVAKRYRIDRFLYNGVRYDTYTYNTLIDLLNNQGVDVIIAKSGMKYNFGTCELNVLYSGTSDMVFSDVNDTSVVSQLNCDKFNAFFPADVSINIEQQLISSGALNDLEVLKVGHHGSKYSTSENFLDVIKPEIAVLTLGKNKFGHPHKTTIDKLEKSGANIYSTFENGMIEIVTDGVKYLVKAKNL